MSKFLLIVLPALLFLGSPVHAGAMHDHHAMTAAQGERCMGMMPPPTGDADVDFVQGMIPHHEMAVQMADDLLKNGHDPELRKLAQDIKASQSKEIAFMKSWLASHPEAGTGPN